MMGSTAADVRAPLRALAVSEAGARRGVTLRTGDRYSITVARRLFQLSLQLLDAFGEEVLAGREYTIAGGADLLRGTTDSRGRLRHDGVLPQPYRLRLHAGGSPVEIGVPWVSDGEEPHRVAVPGVGVHKLHARFFDHSGSRPLAALPCTISGGGMCWRTRTDGSGSIERAAVPRAVYTVRFEGGASVQLVAVPRAASEPHLQTVARVRIDRDGCIASL